MNKSNIVKVKSKIISALHKAVNEKMTVIKDFYRFIIFPTPEDVKLTKYHITLVISHILNYDFCPYDEDLCTNLDSTKNFLSTLIKAFTKDLKTDNQQAFEEDTILSMLIKELKI